MSDWKVELDALVRETAAFTSTVSFNVNRVRPPPREMVEPTGLKPLDFGGSARDEIIKRVQNFKAHQQRLIRDSAISCSLDALPVLQASRQLASRQAVSASA